MQKPSNPTAIELIVGRMKTHWDPCNPGSIEPINTQSRENWVIFSQSEIKPNLTADRQVWSLTQGQAWTGARGSSAILSVPRNPQNKLFWVVTILSQSRPPYPQSVWIVTRFWILCNPIAIKTDCALIGPDGTELRPPVRGLRLDWRMCPVNPNKGRRGPFQSCRNPDHLLTNRTIAP